MNDASFFVLEVLWVWLPLFLMGYTAGWTAAFRRRDKIDAEFSERFRSLKP